MNRRDIDLENLRNRMVDGQLMPRGISDQRVIDVFRRVPRHEFVPEDVASSAYEDYPLPIGEGQTISQPYMVALMTECLGLKGDERVLEIGTGSGYQLAILAELAREVYSVERVTILADRAANTLRRLGYTNFEVKSGDGTLGWEEHRPYDGIMVTAGAPKVPGNLLRQLREGGKLVIPVGGGFGQVLSIVERKGGGSRATEVCGCVFVPLIGKEGWSGREYE